MSEVILVTGATGILGSEVVRQLSRDTPEVSIKAAIHTAENANKVSYPRVETVQIDYDSQASLSKAFKSVDKLFLLTHPSANTVEHESNLINEAKESGVRHIVKQSIMGADLKAEVEAMRLHRQAEIILEESGIPFTFLRPNEFMQGFINFHSPSIKNNNAFYLPAGDAKVSIVDVRDIASVAVKAFIQDQFESHKNKAYVITGPEALSYHQTADILSNATDKKIDYINISEEEASGAMKEMDMDEWLINTILELNSYFKKGYASQVSSVIEEVTGKKPTSFAQFARDYSDAFR